jgi:hypothetical protein
MPEDRYQKTEGRSPRTCISLFLYCHSGLDPWFDRLTTLNGVEGESSAFSEYVAPGCRIKSGMTSSMNLILQIKGQASYLQLQLYFMRIYAV